MALGALSCAFAFAVAADPLVEAETNAALARATHGVTGKNVAVAILDRGIDWAHPDFRNADGSTRIAYIFDLTDSSGANAAGNKYLAGTIYTRAQIDAALNGGPTLATRDAVGHGSATAGNCCGNGRASQGKYMGIAPEATLIVIKLTSDGAPAHGNQPAEAAFWQPSLFPVAVDFAVDKASELGMPLVMLANIGSIGGQADGTDAIALKIDSVTGPGLKGLAFVTGTGDDGGRNNHAAGTVANGQDAALQFVKGQQGPVSLYLWYPGSDRFTVSVASPTASYGPYTPPANNSYDSQTTAEFKYGHNGSIYYADGKRLVYLTVNGPVGTYTVNLHGTSVTSGQFDAYLSPAYYSLNDTNRFLTYSSPGKTIWSGATAKNAIVPTSYVFRTSWLDIDGFTRSVTGEGAIGQLWAGSSIGPTWDGRYGVDVSAPGDHNITTYGVNSYWATFRSNLISDGAGLYGMASAVSAANPLVTGAVALMLQKNPNADAAMIKSALQKSARADSFTGAVPNAIYGYGKLDVNGAVAAIAPKSLADCVMDWAEQALPQYFSPSGMHSAYYGAYYYRYYANTGNYLATATDSHVWVLGPVTGNALYDAGLLTSFQGMAGCQ